MHSLNIQLFHRRSTRSVKYPRLLSNLAHMVNSQWLELPMSRTNSHGPNDVRAIEVRLYFTDHLLFSEMGRTIGSGG